VNVKEGPLDFYSIFLYMFFFIDMPEDSLSTGRNVQYTYEGN